MSSVQIATVAECLQCLLVRCYLLRWTLRNRIFCNFVLFSRTFSGCQISGHFLCPLRIELALFGSSADMASKVCFSDFSDLCRFAIFRVKTHFFVQSRRDLCKFVLFSHTKCIFGAPFFSEFCIFVLFLHEKCSFGALFFRKFCKFALFHTKMHSLSSVFSYLCKFVLLSHQNTIFGTISRRSEHFTYNAPRRALLGDEMPRKR